MMESPGYPPASPLDVVDDAAYPCKGCGEILEEGKAFELAGNRWHLECFRCNTCGTLLDSDANLLLLGDGSLICNNCTYSCNACGNKIEDLAILTGDQAFCAGCFRCRNCKRKIENLRYARTSQGIFCMSCHESLMARRRKKSRNTVQKGGGNLALDKALPVLPPPQDEDEAPGKSSSSSSSQFDPNKSRPPANRNQSAGSTIRNLGDASPASSTAGTPRGSPYPMSSPSQSQEAFARPAKSKANRQSMYSLVSDDASEGVSNTDSRASYFPLVLDDGPPPPIPSTINRSDLYAPRTMPSAVDRRASATPESIHRQQGSSAVPSYMHDHGSQQELRLDGLQEKSSRRALDSEATRMREDKKRENEQQQEAERAERAEARRREAEAERKRERERLLELERERGRLGELEREREKQREHSRQAKERERLRKADRSLSRKSVDFDRESLRSSQRSSVDYGAGGRRASLRPFSIDDDSLLTPQSARSETASTKPTTNSANGYSKPYSTASNENVPPGQNKRSPNQSTDFKLGEVPRTKRATPKPPVDEDDSPKEIEIDMDNIEISISPEPLQELPLRSHSLPQPNDTSAKEQTNVRSETAPTATAQSSKIEPAYSISSPISSDTFVRSHHTSASRTTNSEAGTDFASSEFSAATSSGESASTASPSLSQKQGNSYISHALTPSRGLQRPATSQGTGGGLSAPFDRQMVNGTSPILPPLRSDLNFEEEIGKIFSNNVTATTPIPKRTSKSVKHGRSHSDIAGRASMIHSPNWPRSPSLVNSGFVAPFSPDSPTATTADSKEENLALKTALRKSTQHIVELESKLHNSGETKESLDNVIQEKRTTVASLEAERQLAMIEIESLRKKLEDVDVKTVNFEEFVAAAVREVSQRIQELKDEHKGEIEHLISTKNEALEDTATALRMRDQAIQETGQLNSKNMQLADLNNELTRRIQGTFMANKAAIAAGTSGNGLGIYQPGDMQDFRELRPSLPHSTSSTTITSVQMSEGATFVEDSGAMMASPHVVNIRKPGGQPKKFNWKKGGAAVGKGVVKGFNKVFASEGGNEHYHDGGPMVLQSQPFSTASYGPPVHSNNMETSGLRPVGSDQYGQGNYGTTRGLLKKLKGANTQQLGDPNSQTVPLLGSELEARVEYEGRRIPLIITKCLEEVETRGLDFEGIYRKGGGASQVRMIQESFERGEDIDLEDPSIDITAVTSVLKQYFRKLPTPLVTYQIYERMVDSTKVSDFEKRKNVVKGLINELPSLNRDILFFIINHLTKVAMFQNENLMSARNLAVVFAPSLMRDLTGEFELRDTHAKNEAIQFIIENAKSIFAGVDL